MNTKQIIMRRVYYSYVLSLLTSASFLQGCVFGGAVVLFGRLTHVAAIWNNLLAVPVGRLPEYLVSPLLSTDRRRGFDCVGDFFNYFRVRLSYTVRHVSE